MSFTHLLLKPGVESQFNLTVVSFTLSTHFRCTKLANSEHNNIPIKCKCCDIKNECILCDIEILKKLWYTAPPPPPPPPPPPRYKKLWYTGHHSPNIILPTVIILPNAHKVLQSSSLRSMYDISFWVRSLACNITMTCHNGRDSVSNHQPHDCLLNRLFRRRSKKTSKLRVTSLCAVNSPGTGEFPTQMTSYAENVSIWWRHHGNPPFTSSCCVDGLLQ